MLISEALDIADTIAVDISNVNKTSRAQRTPDALDSKIHGNGHCQVCKLSFSCRGVSKLKMLNYWHVRTRQAVRARLVKGGQSIMAFAQVPRGTGLPRKKEKIDSSPGGPFSPVISAMAPLMLASSVPYRH